MADNFKAYSLYYDLLYRDKNYEAEAAYVADKIRSFNPGAASVLELGCGTGNHAKYLCGAGFSVTGVEQSDQMVKLAVTKNISRFRLVKARITDYKLAQTFDAVISLFHVISYLTSNEDLISCFKNAFNHLKPGGIFLFDIWYSPAVSFQRPEDRVKNHSDDSIEITRIAKPVIYTDENVVEVNYEISVLDKKKGRAVPFHESHRMRHFSIPEIGLLAAHTGFNFITAEEFLTGRHPSENTWAVCFILQKI